MSARRSPLRLARTALPVLLVLGLLAVGLSARSAPAAAHEATQATEVGITILDFAFAPLTVTVKVGDTVTWINNDRVTHTVDADNGAFHSGFLAQGQRFSYVATTPGTYTYYCQPHPFMKATLIVEGASSRNFPETGHTVQGRFLSYWEAHGGLALNGFPISDEFQETLEDGKPYMVQYFERVRLEYHPENTDPAYQVLLGQFGRRIHPADPAVAAQPGARFFPDTGHNVSGGFLTYWEANGGLAQFGLPLTEVFSETLDGKPYNVQYFERARFEYHPENADPQYQVLLGQFGRQILGNR